jgi:hypothetical protein
MECHKGEFWISDDINRLSIREVLQLHQQVYDEPSSRIPFCDFVERGKHPMAPTPATRHPCQ